MRDLHGKLLEDENEIGYACVRFYQDMYAPEDLPHLDFIVFEELQGGTYIDEEMIRLLQTDITRKEITKVLASIGDHKALGLDGLSSLSFKAISSVVGDDFVQAVQNSSGATKCCER